MDGPGNSLMQIDADFAAATPERVEDISPVSSATWRDHPGLPCPKHPAHDSRECGTREAWQTGVSADDIGNDKIIMRVF